MQGVPHYLVDEFMPDEEFNVVKFQEYAKRYLKEIYEKGQIPILVGGTGFYIQAVLYDIDFTSEREDTAYREQLEQLAKEHGAEYLHQMLEKVDAASAKAIHPNNVKRVIRALEFYEKTGKTISSHNEREREKESPYNAAYFVLNDNRDEIYPAYRSACGSDDAGRTCRRGSTIKRHGLHQRYGIHAGIRI